MNSLIISSGELTKFHMFPKGETLHCLKVSNLNMNELSTHKLSKT